MDETPAGSRKTFHQLQRISTLPPAARFGLTCKSTVDTDDNVAEILVIEQKPQPCHRRVEPPTTAPASYSIV
jgi:hypothetical protein